MSYIYAGKLITIIQKKPYKSNSPHQFVSFTTGKIASESLLAFGGNLRHSPQSVTPQSLDLVSSTW